MKLAELKKQLLPIAEQGRKDKDAFYLMYFSRLDNKYSGAWHIDKGDALLIIKDLIDNFNLSKSEVTKLFIIKMHKIKGENNENFGGL